MTSLHVRNLSKAYCGRLALEDISFSAASPQVIGLLGANGAGKSTLMRILAGVIPADAGEVESCGLRLGADDAAMREIIGYLPENAPLYGNLRVVESLRFMARMHGLHGDAMHLAVGQALECCRLSAVRDRLCGTLSKGYRHRLGMAQAIIHKPPLLILDEPTDGLDPLQKVEARQLIRELGGQSIVLISTHIVEEIPQLCDRAIVLGHGRIIHDGAAPRNLLSMLENDGIGGAATEEQAS